MTDIREVLDEVEKGCEGVTPGPWDWGTFANDVGVLGAREDVPFLRMRSSEDSYDAALTTAAYLARLDPQTMLAIIKLARKGLAAEAGEGWQHAAFAETVALATERGMQGAGALSLAHLIDMQGRLSIDMKPGKVGRWLGWAQAALAASGLVTLDEMKLLNKRCSDAASFIAIQEPA